MGGEQRQRILSEMQAGLFPYDLMSIEDEAADDFQKQGFLIDPVNWQKIFGMDQRMIHPQGFAVSVGNNPAGIYYANKPKWFRGNSLAVTMVASGEVILSWPASHGSWYRAAQGKTNFPVSFVFPEGPIVASREIMLSPVKGAPNPNAALLMTGWVAAKGVKYLRTGRESIFHPESEIGAQIKKMGRPLKVTDWDTAIRTEELMRKILEVWGFPKPERKGG